MSKQFSVYSLGKFTYPVNMGMFQLNRERLIARFKADNPSINDGVIFLDGGEDKTRYSSDTGIVFRQESFFQWAFGVREPDCYGAIRISDGHSCLFVPYLPAAYKIWMGKIKTTEHFQENYGVDTCMFTNEIRKYFEESNPSTIYRLKGLNTDSKKTHQPANHDDLSHQNLKHIQYNDELLWKSFVECRVIKTEPELNLMRNAAKISSEAHKKVMLEIRPGWSEFEAESLFCHHVYSKGGMRHVAYCCIAATAENSAILHYGHAGEPNSRHIKDGDMTLFDMGGEYYCYASDITCCYPVNGKFTDDQKIVYQAVYNAWKHVTDNLKVGSNWTEMHIAAERQILTHLKEHGLLKGNVQEMLDNRLGALFMPHGLGHLIGLDVHDVGGYMDHTPPRSKLPGLSCIRTARIMEKNMTITIEPGCYFVWECIEETYQQNSVLAGFMNMNVLERFKNLGGVRIESDVIIHEDRCEDMCPVPRTIEEIESFMGTRNDAMKE